MDLAEHRLRVGGHEMLDHVAAEDGVEARFPPRQGGHLAVDDLGGGDGVPADRHGRLRVVHTRHGRARGGARQQHLAAPAADVQDPHPRPRSEPCQLPALERREPLPRMELVRALAGVGQEVGLVVDVRGDPFHSGAPPYPPPPCESRP